MRIGKGVLLLLGGLKVLLIIDNYDSFTYILADYILQQGCKVRIVRPANITINEIVKLAPPGLQ